MRDKPWDLPGTFSTDRQWILQSSTDTIFILKWLKCQSKTDGATHHSHTAVKEHVDTLGIKHAQGEQSTCNHSNSQIQNFLHATNTRRRQQATQMMMMLLMLKMLSCSLAWWWMDWWWWMLMVTMCTLKLRHPVDWGCGGRESLNQHGYGVM